MAHATPVAKISRPATESAYRRTRLFERLDEACKRPVVCVSGPPGCGKTTLVSSYLADRDLQHLWYQIDEGDADVASFFYYLSQAARQLGGRRKGALPMLTREFEASLTVFTRNFFRELFSRFTAPGILVLDNFLDVPAAADLEHVLTPAFSEVPEGLTVMLISRSDPRTALAGLLARGAVATLGWDELKLSDDESAGIARSRSPEPKLSGSFLRRLDSVSEGWVAGLVLMLEQSVNVPSARTRLEHVERDVVFDFFAGEVFDRRSPDFRTFLLQTAFLPRITEPLARCLTGFAQSEGFLRELVSSNYFTVKRPGEVVSYEYHPLFREFLRQRAARVFSADELTALQRRAAQLLLEEQDPESAAGLFVATEDWEGLGKLIRENAAMLLEQGRRRTLVGWLKKIPAADFDRDPWLAFWKGASMYPYDVDGSREQFERAYWTFKEDGDPTGAYLALVSIVETYFYVLTDFRPLDGWLREMRDLIATYPDYPSPFVEARVTYGMLSCVMWRRPDSPELKYWVERAEAMMQAEVPVGQRVLLGYGLFLYYMRWTGDIPRCAMIMDKVRPMIRRRDSSPYVRLLWKLMQAAYGWVVNAPDEGLRAVRSGLALARKTGVHVFDLLLAGLGAYCCLVKGDLDGAARELEVVRDLQRDNANAELAHYHYLMAWVAMGRHELNKARDHAILALRHTEEADVKVTHTFNQLTLAQVHIESGEYRQASRLLATAWWAGRRMHNAFIEHHCLLAKALISLEGKGHLEQGLRTLRRALRFGRERGYVTHPAIGWRHDVLCRLLQVALEHDIEPAYVKSLIRERELVPESPPLDLEGWPWPVKIHVLSEPAVEIQGKACRVTGKPLELIRTLAATGPGRALNAGTVADNLWPDADGDAAHHSFETTLYRLRKTLGCPQAIEFQDRRVRLDPSYCWVDLWAAEHLLKRLDAAMNAPDAGADVNHFCRRLCGLFSAGAREDYGAAGGTVVNLRQQVLHAVERVGQYWEQRSAWDRAIEAYRRGLKLNPSGEGFYQRLMYCYAQLGRRAEVFDLYDQCRENLAGLLDATPSAQTTDLFRELVGSAPGEGRRSSVAAGRES